MGSKVSVGVRPVKMPRNATCRFILPNRGVVSGTTVYELSYWAASANKLKRNGFERYVQKE